MNNIRHNHPDLKGSFTALGNWYNLLNSDSMDGLNKMIERSSPADKKIAIGEINSAHKTMELWKEKPYLNFLYRNYEKQVLTDLL